MKRINPIYRRLPRSTRLTAPRLTPQQETESKIRREIAVMKKCIHQNLVRLREVIDDPASKKVYLGTSPFSPLPRPSSLSQSWRTSRAER
jgi:SNF1-activating kinase 1